MDYVVCDLCGKDDFRTVIASCQTLDGPLVQCRHCELVYVNPRHSIFAVDEETSDPSASRIAVWEQYSQIWEKLPADGVQEFGHKQANFMLRLERIQQFTSSGELLDVGCSQGHFLDLAHRSGFATIGLEPNEKTAQFARDYYGLSVINGVLPQDNFCPNQFDLITMFHVIEHMPSPSRALKHVHRILRRDGFLFLETPTIDTVWFRLLGKRWRQLIPDHYYFFTHRTIQALLEKEGFKVLEVSTIGKRMSLNFFLTRLRRYNHGLTSVLSRFINKAGIGGGRVNVNLGDIMFVVAEKV